MAKLRTEVFFKVLDSVITQLHDRFPESSLNFVQQMTHFSHEKLLNTGNNTLNPDIVSDLCGYYGLDTEKLCEEFDVFSQLSKAAIKILTCQMSFLQKMINSKMQEGLYKTLSLFIEHIWVSIFDIIVSDNSRPASNKLLS
ncbi:hypothetical protein J6590_088263 [Homalodisca vitripennis]|nr:hypothetical protein J6590_088263 [Homalodisca vitripennis]